MALEIKAPSEQMRRGHVDPFMLYLRRRTPGTGRELGEPTQTTVSSDPAPKPLRYTEIVRENYCERTGYSCFALSDQASIWSIGTVSAAFTPSSVNDIRRPYETELDHASDE